MPITIFSRSAAETFEIGKKLGGLLESGDVVALTGPLGAGKTVFAKGVGAGLGVVEEVLSPSFNIVLEYRGRTLFRHVDFYRLAETKEALDMGMEEYIESEGVTAIEWAGKMADMIPGERLWIKMDFTGDEGRILEFEAHGARFVKMLEQLTKR